MHTTITNKHKKFHTEILSRFRWDTFFNCTLYVFVFCFCMCLFNGPLWYDYQ